MKICSSCQQQKRLDDFHKASRNKDGKQSRCKVCNNEQRKAYYKTAHGKKNNDTSGKRYQSHNKRRIFDYLLTHPCVDCGESNPVVLEFDHRDSLEKSFTICSKSGLDKGWTSIQEEIDKCDVRCCNCHRKRTAEQFGSARLAWSLEHVIE